MRSADVLVIDDDLGTRETFAFLLRDAEVEVRVAETGLRALQLAHERVPTLVLCDLHLPDANGLDVLRAFRRSQFEAPFVLVTGFGSVISALEAGRLGVAEYLEKPVSPEQLLSVVKHHVDAQDLIAPNAHAARARRVIEQRYADPDLSVRAVAQALGLSTQHVCRVLKQHLGVTFADLLRNVRLREARRLLGEPACSLKQIAYQVGFRHPSQFTRAFRDNCGLSPSDYRSRRTKGI